MSGITGQEANTAFIEQITNYPVDLSSFKDNDGRKFIEKVFSDKREMGGDSIMGEIIINNEEVKTPFKDSVNRAKNT
jgi:hypothetical protein